MATDNLTNHLEAQSEALRINFDEAVSEAKSQAIIVEFEGKEYELPPKAPAWLPLFMASRQKNGTIEDSDNIELIEGLLGKEFIAKIVDDRENFVSLEAVNDKIIMPVMNHWGVPVSEAKKKTD